MPIAFSKECISERSLISRVWGYQGAPSNATEAFALSALGFGVMLRYSLKFCDRDGNLDASVAADREESTSRQLAKYFCMLL